MDWRRRTRGCRCNVGIFPGFTSSTGGLPRERDLLARRDALAVPARHVFWRSLGFATITGCADLVAVCLCGCASDRVCHPCRRFRADGGDAAGATMPAIAPFSGMWMLRRRGSLEVRVLPFLPQAWYDELLWACDFNFVRGEDSFVRAQWAARPLVWQPYRQDDGAHQRKLEAFMARYREGLNSGPADAFNAFTRCWNGIGVAEFGVSWRALRACRSEFERRLCSVAGVACLTEQDWLAETVGRSSRS